MSLISVVNQLEVNFQILRFDLFTNHLSAVKFEIMQELVSEKGRHNVTAIDNL